MKPNATPRKPARRRHSYSKVLDNRKHPIRGLWKRNGRFVARITVHDDVGQPKIKWCPLHATTTAEAQDELRTLLVERQENRLRHIGETPKLFDYIRTYESRLKTSGKKPDTLVTEKSHYQRWADSLGHLRLDKIRPHHLAKHLHDLRATGRSPRTCNLALVCLRNILKNARTDGFLKALPVDGIPWLRVDRKERPLFTQSELDLICRAAKVASKNSEQFCDYLRFLSLSGAREQEALRIRWADVDLTKGLVTIGADGDTKNRECRHLDISPDLQTHLKEMSTRRAPDTEWLFPSPQRGDQDARARTFRESLLLTRAVAGAHCPACDSLSFGVEVKACSRCGATSLTPKATALPEKLQRFGFHDCRHHFISQAVMSGIDYMTIARWVGHKDGGVLIGKVYGHLASEHTRAQAARLVFRPKS